MLGNKMNFSSCAIWTGFHKSSHNYNALYVYHSAFIIVMHYARVEGYMRFVALPVPLILGVKVLHNNIKLLFIVDIENISFVKKCININTIMRYKCS